MVRTAGQSRCWRTPGCLYHLRALLGVSPTAGSRHCEDPAQAALPFEGHAGDSLELVVSLVGDLGPESPKFEISIPDTGQGYALLTSGLSMQSGSSQQSANLPTADGVYHGGLPCRVLVWSASRISANGTTTAGRSRSRTRPSRPVST